MKEVIFDEKNGLWYRLVGDYYLPCFSLPEQDQSIGIWGMRHRDYLRGHKQAVYTELLLSGRLNSYLAQIETQAQEMNLRLIDQMAADEGITEQLKAEDQMAWVGAMMNIQARAREIVNEELILR